MVKKAIIDVSPPSPAHCVSGECPAAARPLDLVATVNFAASLVATLQNNVMSAFADALMLRTA